MEALTLLDVWERAARQPPAERALTLLTAVARGEDKADGALSLSALDVGSRNVLLARWLASIVGEITWAQASCGSCGEQLDVPVDIQAIAELPVHPPGIVVQVETGDTRLAFGLPTTADVLALAGLHPESARQELLARCLRSASADESHAGPELPGTLIAAVDMAMERVAPAGAITITVSCPHCDTCTLTVLDISVLLWAEIDAQALSVLDDVHVLADAYGWSEAEVLALGPGRRAAYLRRVLG